MLSDVDEALVGSDLELFTSVFIDEGRTIDGDLVDLGREGDGARDEGSSALSRLEDGLRTFIGDLVVEGADDHANLWLFSLFGVFLLRLFFLSHEKWR